MRSRECEESVDVRGDVETPEFVEAWPDLVATPAVCGIGVLRETGQGISVAASAID